MSTEYVVYRGERFRIQTSGRYFQSGRKDADERLLHRRVWSDHNGPIPERHHVHHIDGDWRNNDIANLRLVEENEHQRDHKLERLAEPGAREQNAEWLERARLAAAEWHGSAQGLEWHRQHGADTWIGRPYQKLKCAECGTIFETRNPRGSKFCSRACWQRQNWRNRGYHTDARQCAWCGKQFMANRHRKTLCCSRLCSNRKREADRLR